MLRFTYIIKNFHIFKPSIVCTSHLSFISVLSLKYCLKQKILFKNDQNTKNTQWLANNNVNKSFKDIFQ